MQRQERIITIVVEARYKIKYYFKKSFSLSLSLSLSQSVCARRVLLLTSLIIPLFCLEELTFGWAMCLYGIGVKWYMVCAVS